MSSYYYNNESSFYKPFHISSQYSGAGVMGGGGYGSSGEGEVASQIRQQIEVLKGKVAETGVELDRCRQEQEAFSVEYYTLRESHVKYENMEQQVNKSCCCNLSNLILVLTVHAKMHSLNRIAD